MIDIETHLRSYEKASKFAEVRRMTGRAADEIKKLREREESYRMALAYIANDDSGSVTESLRAIARESLAANLADA